jgi:tyrosinase
MLIEHYESWRRSTKGWRFMTYLRQSVYDPAAQETLEWYAKAVAKLQQVPIAERQSWAFFAAIHGIVPEWWTYFGWKVSSPPRQSDQDKFWAQCQHQSWYFLPWHRGYVLAFEAMIRAAVVSLGGPESWALPYWNYNNPNETSLPQAFAAPASPLYIKQRYGPGGDGNVYIPAGHINLNAMGDPVFEGNDQNPEFGGVPTGFSHDGNTSGGIESQPHNMVHVLVGGAIANTDPNNWQNNGLMSMPDTAALDPIFWLHHCNIDRLWEGWNETPRADPTDPNWLGGPAASGERAFVMPMPDGSEWTYTPQDMVSISDLGYSYDDAPAAPELKSLFERQLAAVSLTKGIDTMVGGKRTELIGASESRISLAGTALVPVRLDPQGTNKVRESFTAALSGRLPQAPGRVFLNLENVRGAADSLSYQVYVNVPEGEDPKDHPERLAGSIGLFGLSKATQSDSPHGGNGLSFSLEITNLLGDLHLNEGLDADNLQVRIVPRVQTEVAPDVTVDRVSVYREES